jgi:hypothetical protein
LAERAKALGCSAQQCLVIDDDLGVSGAQVSNRPGYQRLVSLVALRAHDCHRIAELQKSPSMT